MRSPYGGGIFLSGVWKSPAERVDQPSVAGVPADAASLFSCGASHNFYKPQPYLVLINQLNELLNTPAR